MNGNIEAQPQGLSVLQIKAGQREGFPFCRIQGCQAQGLSKEHLLFQARDLCEV